MADDTVSMATERIARLSYGKLVAMLAVRSRDVAAAEDALGGALVRALGEWPRLGVPANPEAWLVTVARRIDADRWRRVVTAAKGADRWLMQEDERLTAEDFEVPDDRLRLMLVCAHPAIDPDMRTALMLQVVLGIDARRIGSAFLIAPATMGQRLSRAKARIADAGLRFQMPDRSALPERIESVLAAIYAAYTLGWDLAFVDADRSMDLVEEAIWLVRLVIELAPGNAEALALLSLLLFAEARRAARRDPATGDFVPLSEQDTARWDGGLIAEAERMLRQAGAAGGRGRFGYEAAIQAVHANRRVTGTTDWSAIEQLYRGLLSVSPTIGAHIGHAVAAAETIGAASALSLLDAIPDALVAAHQPYWVARAHVLDRANETRRAVEAYACAIGLTEDAASRRFLTRRQAMIRGGSAAQHRARSAASPQGSRSGR
jgi:RNA polymerase sigma-70 factor (ECF subfamily)